LAADERRDGEVGAGPGSAQVAEGDDEECQAHPVGGDAQPEYRRDVRHRRKVCTEGECEGEGDRLGDQTLQGGEPLRVGQSDLPRQAVF